jgi:hypothetical protein
VHQVTPDSQVRPPPPPPPLPSLPPSLPHPSVCPSPGSATQFETIVEYLTEGFTGHRNLLGWKKDFDRYCHPKLKVMFIGQFEKFVQEHIRILWGLDEIQVPPPPLLKPNRPSPPPLLQLKFRTYNIGRGYWEAKNAKFLEVRQKLGFVMS